MYGTTLIPCVREHLRDRFQHTQILIPGDETDAGKSPLLKPYKERAPVFPILFHSFRSTYDPTTAVFINTDGHKDRDILYLTAPAALEIDSVHIDIRISATKRSGTPLFDMFIGFFVEAAHRAG